jgi:hypothetical protein
MTPRRAKPVVKTQDYSGPRGWDLIARKQLQIGGDIYPRGSKLPVEDLAPEGIARLVNTKCVEWLKPSMGVNRPKPRKLVVPPPEPERPKFELVAGRDPLETYKLSRTALVKACGGNAGLADDIIMREAKDMYLTACREAGRSL